MKSILFSQMTDPSVPVFRCANKLMASTAFVTSDPSLRPHERGIPTKRIFVKFPIWNLY
jgi:hypothetical protein